MSWQEQRRLDKAAAAAQARQDASSAAEQARQDALAAARIEQLRVSTRTETEQARAGQRADLERQARADRDKRRAARWDRRAAWWKGLRVWAAAHVVDLMIYPLAAVSAVMAIPAMAAFGFHVYGTAAGYALPVITELGMWAFAFAVHLVRHRSERDGQDRPVWALQTGVWSFAAVAAGLNFVHGFTTPPAGLAGDLLKGAVLVPPVAAGAVMAVASVAGVMAHQLVTAAPRRGRADREAARIERRAAVKVTRVRTAAVRSAVAEIDDQGGVRLVFTPGHYQLTRARIAVWRRNRRGLESVALPGLPVTPAMEEGWDDLDRELAFLIARTDPYPGPRTGPATSPGDGSGGTGGGVGILEPDATQPGDDRAGSPPIKPLGDPAKRSRTARGSGRGSATGSARKSGQGSGGGSGRSARSIEELRGELERVIEADPGAVDPGSAESIRRVLRCSPKRARELRDSYQNGGSGEVDR